MKTIGSIAGFQYISRDSEVRIFSLQMLALPFVYPFLQLASGDTFESLKLSPNFANGTTIPNGDYRILVRALRITGDPLNEGDYDSWLSEAFGVRVPQNP